MKCPGCSKSVTAAHDCVHYNRHKAFVVRLTQGMADSTAGSLAQYRLRLVDTLPAFIETIRILDAGLNDAIVEMCKRQLRLDRGIGAGVNLEFLTIDDDDFLRFTAVVPAAGTDTSGRYVTYSRADYEAMCKKLHDLFARSEQKGAWLKIDNAHFTRISMSRRSF